MIDLVKLHFATVRENYKDVGLPEIGTLHFPDWIT